MPAWLSEGAATFIEPMASTAATGLPVALERAPCAYADNIAKWESLDPERGTSEFSCSYALGERLFHDLYRSLGENAFRQGFGNLYLLSLADDPKDDCEGVELVICHVEAAFKSVVTADAGAIVDKVIDRWYEGSEPHDTSRLDTGPVDPSLQNGTQGTLTPAYISLDKDRREESQTDSFSANEVQGQVHLTLHFSYPRIPDEQEFPFMVVEYFEDGFAYNIQNRTTAFQSGWTSSWNRFAIGPGQDRKWAPGRYWVYIYHEGRKIAEVEYQVTP